MTIFRAGWGYFVLCDSLESLTLVESGQEFIQHSRLVAFVTFDLSKAWCFLASRLYAKRLISIAIATFIGDGELCRVPCPSPSLSLSRALIS